MLDLAQRVLALPDGGGTASEEAEDLVLEHLDRLRPWGRPELSEIRWVEGSPPVLTTDGSVAHRALEHARDVAKRHGRYGPWLVARRALHALAEAAGVPGRAPRDLADRACWCVIDDLVEEADPYEPLIRLLEAGVVPWGLGLESPNQGAFVVWVPPG